MKSLLLAFVVGALAPAVHAAAPQINVGAIYDYLEGDKSTYLKRIYNGGDSTAFVKVSILEMHYNADGSHVETPVATMGAAGDRDGLIASPARLIIPAQGMQSTRLIFRGDRDKERYYRVRFVPVIPTKDDAFALDETERESYKNSLSAGVQVMTGYGVAFFVRPAVTVFDTRQEDAPGEYRITNAGNSTIVLDDLKSCSAASPHECEPPKKAHIRPGQVFRFEKVQGRVYGFELVEGAVKKHMEVR